MIIKKLNINETSKLYQKCHFASWRSRKMSSDELAKTFFNSAGQKVETVVWPNGSFIKKVWDKDGSPLKYVRKKISLSEISRVVRKFNGECKEVICRLYDNLPAKKETLPLSQKCPDELLPRFFN